MYRELRDEVVRESYGTKEYEGVTGQRSTGELQDKDVRGSYRTRVYGEVQVEGVRGVVLSVVLQYKSGPGRSHPEETIPKLLMWG